MHNLQKTLKSISHIVYVEEEADINIVHSVTAEFNPLNVVNDFFFFFVTKGVI